jgi:hypothetical protein
VTADTPLTVHRVDPGAMSERTVAIVEDWLAHGATPTDVAVLARVNSALLPVQVALGHAGVPRTAPLDPSVLGRTGIRVALAYLRMGLDPERLTREDIRDTLNRPSRKVKSAVEPLLQRSPRWSLDRLYGLTDLLSGKHAERLAGYCNDLQRLTDAITDGADTHACLDIIRDRIGLGEAMDTLDASSSRPEGSSHGDDLDALAQLADLHPDPVTFREWLVESLRIEGDEDGVTLSTVHRVKGMEWDRVVVFAANEGLLPHRLAEDVEEERRIFHVAVTRCRSHVAVVANRDGASPFLAELTAPGSHRGVVDSPPSRPAPTAPRRRDDGRVIAGVGLDVVLPGGIAARVVEVDGADAVALTEQGVELRVPLGATVQVTGDEVRLAPPARRSRTALPGTDVPIAGDPAKVDALFEALRAWRKRAAEAAGLPAYIVFNDATLRGIAERQPSSARELTSVPGVGPAKLERYGDDVLALVEDLT